jgi:hypothetical protein
MRPIMTPAALAITGAMLGACVEVSSPPRGGGASAPAQLALFGPGYPDAGDPCRRAGESAFTANYLDDAADLVACPPSTDVGLFAFTYGAQQVATLDGWSLFSIPRR